MTTLNCVHLVGRAGRDAEVRYFESGSVLCTVTLAVNRVRRRGETAEEETPPDWFDLEFWGKTAEIAGEYVQKGSLIGVTGTLSYSRWVDRTTQQPRERPVIKVDQLELLGRPGRSESATSAETL